MNAINVKPYADVYIDDRAIQFNGDWDKTIKEALKFQSWEKRKDELVDSTVFATDFLIQDFNQSYQQLRHYDSLSWDITKFSFIELLLEIAEFGRFIYILRIQQIQLLLFQIIIC